MVNPDADPGFGRAPIVWTIVVAGGSGLRFGERKQFADLRGRSVVQHAVDAAAESAAGIVAVVPADVVATCGLDAPEGTELVVVAGAETRSGSVRAGLDAVPAACDIVLVHDAARPLATPGLFSRTIAAVCEGAEAVVPAVRVPDTIRHRDGGVADREDLLAVQTPQGFPADVLRRAHAGGEDATDDASLVERRGGTVVVIDGEPQNRKITDRLDLVTADAMLGAREEAS